MDPKLFSLVASELPAIVVILIVEHIAIAKSFGRIYNYTIVPSQEMIAQGAANLLGPFVGGYVCTGSFGASAVLSKAAVRTPLAGLFSALVLVLALYALTGVFYYIPHAALAGLILHCTINLITPPKMLYKYWKLSPFELFIWVCGVVIAFFTNLETAIYVTVGLSFVMLLFRMAKSPGKFRGSVAVTRLVGGGPPITPVASCSSSMFTMAAQHGCSEHEAETRQVYLPYGTEEGRNPKVAVKPAYPGVFIYRFSENFNYINQAYHINYLTTYIKSNTRKTRLDDGICASDRLWCDTPLTADQSEKSSSKPKLRAVVLDFSTINIIDITSLQGLIDLRNTLDRHAAPTSVEWHFAGVHNPWTRRALAFAGFGFPAMDNEVEERRWCPAYTVATSLACATEADECELECLQAIMKTGDIESKGDGYAPPGSPISSEKRNHQPLCGVDRPFFHIDLHDAVDAAVRDAKKQDKLDRVVSCSSSEWSGLRGEP